jgi:hypothetical protein
VVVRRLRCGAACLLQRGTTRTLGIQNGAAVQLRSEDSRITIHIEQAKRGGSHAPYQLRMEGRDSVGRFLGENNSVHFLNVDEFTTALQTFLKARQGSATLRAPDDCELEFFRWNTKGDIGVRFAIATRFIDDEASEYSKLVASGRFKLHGQYAEQMAAQLLDVLNA